ncbi:GntR family transcriptional regulator [Anaerovorax odorimutans]|uniref:GntR family transcriptional regulator n=1 Tax=Anaerovorax odorimutans TaxID=109327 RepID=UPI000403B759|nr:GntR family transcriptional regulator [Anaerovorax odorimutans]
MLNFDIQSHRPLREIVYEELRSLILTGKIKPGTRMMEIELAEDMGVSRTPIREAIRKLEKEGLVTIEPRKGAYASEVSVKDMVDILEVRGNLEGLAAYFAATRMNDTEKQTLLSISDDFDRAVAAGDMAGMISSDTRFHHYIVECCKNNYLMHMVEQLQELVLRFRYIYFKDFKRAEEMPAEHKIIYSAILNCEEETARFGAVNHIDKLKEMILKDESFE